MHHNRSYERLTILPSQWTRRSAIAWEEILTVTTVLPTQSDFWGSVDVRRGLGDLESGDPKMSSTDAHHSHCVMLRKLLRRHIEIDDHRSVIDGSLFKEPCMGFESDTVTSDVVPGMMQDNTTHTIPIQRIARHSNPPYIAGCDGTVEYILPLKI